MLEPPLADLKINYFSDASAKNTVPDSFGAVGDVVRDLNEGQKRKFGTQEIISAFPSILSGMIDSQRSWMDIVFGPARVSFWRQPSLTLTVPVFMARGSKNHGDLAKTSRTDLHAEPITNVVISTEGKKKWTLVHPMYSWWLRPTISPDGRAYFYSMLDPLVRSALDRVPRYEIITERNDILYVPAWFWHRVEYLPDETAVSVSLFEAAPIPMFKNNPLFFVTLVPNLVKEFLRIKKQ
jgi:hypothetical protein